MKEIGVNGTLLLLASFLILATEGLKLHVITWNVADNKRMEGQELHPEHFSQLLGIKSKGESSGPADIYAISLQENCFKCDNNDINGVANIVIKLLKKNYGINYKLVELELTRDSSTCHLRSCTLSGLHGTSVMMAIVRDVGLVSSSSKIKVTHCTRPLIFGYKNPEKGLAGVMLNLKNNAAKLCFVGGHLDSSSPKYRQDCVNRFFKTAAENEWTKCDHIYVMGDFNTRTAENLDEPNGKQGVGLPDRVTLQKLIEHDELTGKTPFGGKALIDTISQASGRSFQEPMRPIVDVNDFLPTFSLLEAKYCAKDEENDTPQLCYRSGRSPAWTDRIVCTDCGAVESYSSYNSLAPFSDHLPVVARFNLNI